MKWYYLLTGLIILVLFLVSKLSFQIIYKREKENDIVEIIISYLKFIKWKHQISLIDVDKKGKESGIKLHSRIFGNIIKDKDPHKFIDFKTIIKNSKSLKEYYNEYENVFRSIIKSVQKNIVFKDININLEYGLRDSAYTGVALGIIYSLIWNIYTFFSHKVKIINHNINIVPNFNFKSFKINFNCIFNIRVGNIINISFQILHIVLLSLMHNLKHFTKIGNLFNLFTLKSDKR